MGLADDIINKKKKKSLADEIIEGTYNSNNSNNTPKTEVNRVPTMSREERINNVSGNINRMNNIINTMQENKKTVLPTASNKSKNVFPVSYNMPAVSENERLTSNTSYRNITGNISNTPIDIAESDAKIEELTPRKLAELTNYKTDKRNNFEKIIDDITGVGGNIVMGALSVAPSTAKYINEANKLAFSKVGGQILKNITGNEVIGKMGENVVSNIYNNNSPLAKLNDAWNNEEAENWRNQVIQANIDKTSNPITNKLAQLAPSIGQNALPMAVTAVNPLAGSALFMTSAAGNYLDEAKERGMNDVEGFAYASIMGALEGGTEAVISGNMVSKIKKLATGTELSSKILGSFGLDVTENFFQEAVMEPASEIVATVTGGEDKANWDNMLNRAITSGIDGALSAILMAGASIGVGKATNAVNKLNNNEQLTDTELKEAIQDIEATGKVDTKGIIQNSMESVRDRIVNTEQVSNATNSNNTEQSTNTAPYVNEKFVEKGIDKTQNNVYNVNRNEGEINEQIDRGRQEEINKEFDRGRKGKNLERGISESRVLEEHVQKEYTEREYREWEKSIKPKLDNELSIEESELRTDIKNKTGKETIFVKYSNQNGYYAGASLDNPNVIYIDSEKAKKFGLKQTAYHETMESNIRFANSNNKDVITSLISDIMSDSNFQNQKLEFWKEQKGNMPSDFAIAKDIICDRYAELNGTEIDYENVLSDELKNRIDMSIEYFNEEIHKNENVINENSNRSSFSMGNNVETTQETDNNVNNINDNVNNSTSANVNTETNENVSDKINENININEKREFRKHYDSIIKSNNTTEQAKKIAKELMGIDTYVPESNVKQLERADERISNAGADSELNSLMSRAVTGGNIKADDIAVGERLIQYYSKSGDGEKLSEAIRATAMAGTAAGQTVQAMSLLNHQTPQGQAVWLQRSVEKMNNDLKKTRGQNAEQFNLTNEMLEKIVNSENTEEMYKNLDEVYHELGQQVSKTAMQKIDAWRYFSMLFNLRTHVRNITGNLVMGQIQTTKNKLVAGTIEDVASKFNPDMERTHTIRRANKEVKAFAKNDIKNVADRLELNSNKYNPKSRLENSMRTFKSNALENTLGKLFDFNDNMLEVEDGWGLKAGYVRALSEYMTANKLNPNTITDAQLSKARNYAVQQALEATFHQASALATALNQFQNKNKLTKFLTDATLPFKKTPINVAKAGIEYSPLGLTKSAIFDTIQLRKGNITLNTYIDNISKGLTGTGIALLGYALANAGVLRVTGSDDKNKENYEQEKGNQTYSIRIGDNTYSLDWLAPSGIPLFIGAKVCEIIQNEKETKTSTSSDDETSYSKAIETATNILSAFTNAVDPMTEMSMLSGLSSAIKSYDNNLFAGMAVNMGKSYVNQFIPTALGQVAKTADEYERSTSSTKTGLLPKAIDQTKNQIMSKIPGLRQLLPTKTDVWGNDVKQNENIIARSLENAVLPWNRKEISNSNVDKNITELYENTGESSVLPKNINKNLTIDKEKYTMTSDEYAKYKKEYGQLSYKLLNNLVEQSDYKKLADEDKQTIVEKIYSYAKEKVKTDYAKDNNIKYESSTSKNIDSIKVKGNTVTIGDEQYYKVTNINMSEKEIENTMGKFGKGNIDLTKRPIVKNEDGSISTVRSMSFQDESGKEILIPTVVNGEILSNDAAIENYYKTGEYLGKFNTVDEANEYAKQLHEQQERLYGNQNNEKKWVKLTDEEVAKNKNIDLNTYADYKERVVQETIKQRKNGDIAEDGSIKDKDKISILLNYNFTNTEKKELFVNYILDSDDKLYNYFKSLGNTDKVNQFLKYYKEKGDIEGEKNEKGKTISGSVKEATQNYINNLKITFGEKLLLYASTGNYTLSYNEKLQLFNYIKGLSNMTNTQKQELVSSLKCFQN